MGEGEAAPRSPELAATAEAVHVRPEEAAGLARPPRAGHRLLVLALLLAGSLAAAVEDHAGWRLTSAFDPPQAWTVVVRRAGDWGPYLGVVAAVLVGLLRARRQERRWRRRRPGLAARTFGQAPSLRDALGATLLFLLVPVVHEVLAPHLAALDGVQSPWPMITSRQSASSLLTLGTLGGCAGLLLWLWLRGGPTVVTSEHAVSASPFGLGAALVPLARCRVTHGPTSVTLVRDRRLPLRLEVDDGQLERLAHALTAAQPPGPSVEPLRRLIVVAAAPVVIALAMLAGALGAIVLSRGSPLGVGVAPLAVATAWLLLRRVSAGAAPVDVGRGALVVDEQLVPWSLGPRVALARGWLVVEARRTRVAAWVGAAGATLAPALEAGLGPAGLAPALPGWVAARQVRSTALLGGALLALFFVHRWAVTEGVTVWESDTHGTIVNVFQPLELGDPRLRLFVDARAADGSLLPVVVDPAGRWVERGGQRYDLPPWASLGVLDRDGIAFETGPRVRRGVARTCWPWGPTWFAGDDDRPLARAIRTGAHGLVCVISAARPGELGFAARFDRGALTFVAVIPSDFRWPPPAPGCGVCRLAALHPGRALRARGPTVTTGPLPSTTATLAAIERLEAGTAPVTSVGGELLPALFPELPPPGPPLSGVPPR